MSFPFSEVLVLKNYSSEQRQQLQAFARSLEQGGSLLPTPREQAARYDDRHSDFSRDSRYVSADFERYERFPEENRRSFPSAREDSYGYRQEPMVSF